MLPWLVFTNPHQEQPEIQRKGEQEEKDSCFFLPQSKFSHFSNKMLTSRWNNTLLSTGIGWNFRYVSLLLGHIQPVATENTAWTKPALCCEEIAALVAVGFGITLFTLPINSSLQTPTKPLFHHSLWHPCGGVSSTCQAVYCCSDRERKTEVSSFRDSLVNTAQTFSEERINSYLYEVDAFVVDSQHQKFSSTSSQLLSNCHRTSVQIKETFQTH